MINIIFFPFTHMNPDQAGTMADFFPEFRVLNLTSEALSDPGVKELVDKGGLVPVPVEKERIAQVDAQVRSYMDWAGLHKGNEKNLKALIQENPYFQDETDVTAIQSRIRQGPEIKTSAREKDRDPLLFLRFAEIWDRENETIQKELLTLEKNNSALFAELRGEEEIRDVSPVSAGRPDPGNAMTRERIEAWNKVAGEAGMFDSKDGSQVLVTTSPAVFDYLTGSTDQEINGLDIDSIKVHENGCDHKGEWQRDLYHTFDDIFSGNTPDWTGPADEAECCSLSGRIWFCLFPRDDEKLKIDIPGRQIAVCLVELNS